MHSEEESTDEFKKISKAWKTSEDGTMDIEWMITVVSSVRKSSLTKSKRGREGRSTLDKDYEGTVKKPGQHCDPLLSAWSLTLNGPGFISSQ